MKKLILLVFSVIASTVVHAQITTPAPSPFSKIEQKIGLTDVTLEYSRPSMRGRTIFGDLVPYGTLWRLGANASTKITFSTDVTIENTVVKAGSYAIYATPNETSWNIVFYDDISNSGTPKNWDDSKVVAMVNAAIYPMTMPIETFTITFDDLSNNAGTLGILWEQTYVGVKIEVPTDNMVLANINDVMNGTPKATDYYAAAVYYLQSGKDIKQAKIWVDKAVNMLADKVGFWQLRQQSLIYAKAGDTIGAIAIAKKSMVAAQEAGNADYVKMNKDSLMEWGDM